MRSNPVRRKVTVQRNTLRFSAAHFTTFGGQCEPLHGHNYDVLVEVEGELTADAWVLDFTQLKGMVRRLCQPLDHHFILPLRSPVLTISEATDAWEIAFQERRYVIPKTDVCPLPIDNSTAERLAEWFCLRLKEELAATGATNIMSITVGVEEAPGQAGWCTITL